VRDKELYQQHMYDNSKLAAVCLSENLKDLYNTTSRRTAEVKKFVVNNINGVCEFQKLCMQNKTCSTTENKATLNSTNIVQNKKKHAH